MMETSMPTVSPTARGALVKTASLPQHLPSLASIVSGQLEISNPWMHVAQLSPESLGQDRLGNAVVTN